MRRHAYAHVHPVPPNTRPSGSNERAYIATESLAVRGMPTVVCPLLASMSIRKPMHMSTYLLLRQASGGAGSEYGTNDAQTHLDAELVSELHTTPPAQPQLPPLPIPRPCVCTYFHVMHRDMHAHHVFKHNHTRICTHVYTHIYAHATANTRTHVHVHVLCTCVRLCTRMPIHLSSCARSYQLAYNFDTHVYTHTKMRTYTSEHPCAHT